jgi:hypothetical protein
MPLTGCRSGTPGPEPRMQCGHATALARATLVNPPDG